MKIGRHLSGLLLSVGMALPASAQSPPPLPDDVAQAIVTWTTCRGEIMRQRIGSKDTAETIADAALKACEASHAELVAAVARRFPGASPSLLKPENARAEMITLVEQRRRGGSGEDPALAWGVCIGDQAQAELKGPGSGDEIADHAFKACELLEQKVIAKLTGAMDDGQASAALAQTRALMRARVLAVVNDARSTAR